jgi:hypothetical protein
MGFGDRPIVLPYSLRWLITVVAITFATLIFLKVVNRWEALTSDVGQHLDGFSTTEASKFFLTVHVLAVLTYLVVMDSRSIWWLGDRYLLLCLPFLVLFIAHIGNARITWLSFAGGGLVMFIFAAFSLASIHDYTNEQICRRAVFEDLVARGFPPNEIIIGLEQDLWREVETKGFVDYRFQNPSYSPAWSYQNSRNVSLLKPQAATVLGVPPGISPIEGELVCFRSLLIGQPTCVYGTQLRHDDVSIR